MPSITEQFSAATKSQLEAQFQLFNTFASAAMQSAEKMIALNISATKASVAKSSAAAKKLLQAKDPKEFFSLSTSEPPSFDGLIAYGRELAGIAAAAQSELIETTQHTIKQVTSLATTPATVPSKTSPALAAAVHAAVAAVEEPVDAAVDALVDAPAPKPVVVAAANEPVAEPVVKVAKAPAKPKLAAAPIAAAKPVAVVADVKHSFPAPKPIALAPAIKPAKLKSVTPKVKPAPGKPLDIVSGGKGKK
jgi:phasin family protein